MSGARLGQEADGNHPSLKKSEQNHWSGNLFIGAEKGKPLGHAFPRPLCSSISPPKRYINSDPCTGALMDAPIDIGRYCPDLGPRQVSLDSRDLEHPAGLRSGTGRISRILKRMALGGHTP